MKFVISLLSGILLLSWSYSANAQEKMFKKVISGATIPGEKRAITQDHQGFMWFGIRSQNGGLYRYDGSDLTIFRHDPRDSNSLSNNFISSLITDSEGIIWIGTAGGGLERFDPINKSFTHFRHDPKDPASLSSDSVGHILEDHAGKLWMATLEGINVLDRSTGKFTLYTHNPNDPSSITKCLFVWSIYEDSQHNIWLATFGGGLDMFDRKTGKFIHFKNEKDNYKSIGSDTVTAILEDSRGNFWVGSLGERIFQKLDRKTGVFTDHIYDKNHPNRPGSVPYVKDLFTYTNFIKEDKAGKLWIGSGSQGINTFDPATKKTTHHGLFYKSLNPGDIIYDTIGGFLNRNQMSRAVYQSKDGLLWIGDVYGDLYQINPFITTLSYYPIKNTVAVNSFHQDNKGDLWIGLNEGLLFKPVIGPEKMYVNDPKNPNSLSNNIINWILPDLDGNLILATGKGGVNIFDRSTKSFRHFRHNPTDSNSLSTDLTSTLYHDNENNVWVSTDTGLNKLNLKTGLVTRYLHNPEDSNSIINNLVYVATGQNANIWAGTESGLSKLNTKSGNWEHYLRQSRILSIFLDSKGILWVGTNQGLYQYSPEKNNFTAYSYYQSAIEIGSVLNITEDHSHHLWITSRDKIYRLNQGRDSMKVYGSESGVHPNELFLVDNIITKDGEMFIGDVNGYYSFDTEKLNTKWNTPDLYISGFQMGNEEIKPGKNSPIEVSISSAKEVKLKHNQNSFSFEFNTMHYAIPGEIKYLYQLENYDSTWQYLGSKNRVYFFNVPPGDYVLHVRAVASNGTTADKSINIFISQPWYFTWWGILIQVGLLILLVSGVSYFRSRQLRRQNKVLESKVDHRTKQLNQSLNHLKSTQTQLIHSEKMASLGELTAGIAHEIQNPLNFVNNFSEVSNELIDEMNEELAKGDLKEATKIAADIKQNLEKINHHGKRAGDIVKSMLQHSRASTGTKEATDINALADEYLRLSYHGLRAKDKSFNADFKTDFDINLEKINAIPQDIGRVLLNILNNAFFAVKEKKQQSKNGYEPKVLISTKRNGDFVEITVKDNGNGIPQEAMDKIFQPFFTTKPTGQGTGLGLSLSYDIVKAHGGDMKVETKEEEGTTFTVSLPVG